MVIRQRRYALNARGVVILRIALVVLGGSILAGTTYYVMLHTSTWSTLVLLGLMLTYVGGFLVGLAQSAPWRD